MKNEKWKPVVGYEGLYEVSDLGRVRSLWYGRIKVLSPQLHKKGYYDVKLYKNGEKMKHSLIHRLVYQAFRGPIPPGMTVDHLNGIRTDNRLENLQLLTRGDNARKSLNKQLDLLEADWPFREFTFPSSRAASAFFGYQNQSQVGIYISQARKRGENFISLRKKKYFFSQAS